MNELFINEKNNNKLQKKLNKRHRFKKLIIIIAVFSVLYLIVEFNFSPLSQRFSFQHNKNLAVVNELKDKDYNEYSDVIEDEEAVPAISPNEGDWKLRLVNTWNKIPENYKPNLKYLSGGQAIDERAYPDLREMMDDCREQGLSPTICSSYRTMEKQQSLFDREVNQYISQGYTKEKAQAEAGKWVAVPGTSEHQLGLALDIVASSHQALNESQEKTAEQQWLMENCYKYGFILRYPTDKSKITGIGYEPWHYRYVGKEVASKIMQKGICLEEYLQKK